MKYGVFAGFVRNVKTGGFVSIILLFDGRSLAPHAGDILMM